MILRTGSVGTVRNILAEGASPPSYVKFMGHRLDCTHAAEVLIARATNSDVMWKDFSNMHVTGDEVMVMVTYRALMADFEIEYEG